jgi:predicted DNA-binding transcriptional regulator YafY
VKIRFEGYAARVVAERRWHPSQKIQQIDHHGDAIEFTAHLAGLEDITRWILSWGSKARVIGPAELKERVRKEVLQMARI